VRLACGVCVVLCVMVCCVRCLVCVCCLVLRYVLCCVYCDAYCDVCWGGVCAECAQGRPRHTQLDCTQQA